MNIYLAIDLGASSGRHIAGWKENGEIKTEEIYRFANGAEEKDGRLTWNVVSLFNHIKAGLKVAFEKFGAIESVAVDTWGVDYVLMDGDKEIFPCYAYRDERTAAVVEEAHAKMPFSEMYLKTGLMYAVFNSVYQFYCDQKSGRAEKATDYLMLPEYFSYKLTGVKAHEYTNATTTGLLNAETHDFDGEIIERLGLKKSLFSEKPKNAGYVLGELKEDVQREVGGNTKVVLCASHDTASAVHGIPMQGNSPYISSGTWSLMGIKSDKAILVSEDLSNEGGVNNTFRYQKNIMGMWVINKLKETLKTPMTFAEMDAGSLESDYDVTFDVNAQEFFAPDNMREAILDHIKAHNLPLPKSEKDLVRAVYRSLAKCYRETYELLEKNTGKTYTDLYIVGGGAKNKPLNKFTQEFTGKNVVALPIESTALGNLKIQMGE
ncbi:MAG: rhamnulokinase [Bacillota bacterium]|nr:MAG: rhamnulokinase [Bacillota bacterium]